MKDHVHLTVEGKVDGLLDGLDVGLPDGDWDGEALCQGKNGSAKSNIRENNK